MGKPKLWSIFIWIVVVMTGCTTGITPSSAPTLTPSLSPTAPTAALPSPTRLPTSTIVPTRIPPLTPSPQPTIASAPHACVSTRPALAPPPNMTFNLALSGAILQSLNGGMPVSALNQVLQRAGIGNYPYAAVSVDLNGDGALDTAVSLANPQSKTKPPQGVLLIFLCKSQQFQQTATYTEPVTTMAWGAPIIQFAQDLNADRRAELVISAAHCDAKGVNCAEHYAILGWRNGGLRDLLRDAGQAFPSPVPFVEDPDGDGIYDFVLETGDGQRLTWYYHQGVWTRQP